MDMPWWLVPFLITSSGILSSSRRGGDMFLSQVTSKKFWKLEIDQNLFNWLNKNQELHFLRILTLRPGIAPKLGPGSGSTLNMANGYNKCCAKETGSRLQPSGLSSVWNQGVGQMLTDGNWSNQSDKRCFALTVFGCFGRVDGRIRPLISTSKRGWLRWAVWRGPPEFLVSLERQKSPLSDNLAAVLCFDKGRSSSPAMNRLCRVAAAF